jgi:hypothetical protein
MATTIMESLITGDQKPSESAYGTVQKPIEQVQKTDKVNK